MVYLLSLLHFRVEEVPAKNTYQTCSTLSSLSTIRQILENGTYVFVIVYHKQYVMVCW